MIAIRTVRELAQQLRVRPYSNYTSIGSYTLMYVHHDGECSHPACVRRHAADEMRKVRDGSHDRIVCLGTYDEGPTLDCALCCEPIESSYGDPDIEPDSERTARADHERDASKDPDSNFERWRNQYRDE